MSRPVAEGSRHYIDLEKLDATYLAALRKRMESALGTAGYADEDARDVIGELDRAFFTRDPPPWSKDRIASLTAGLPSSLAAYRTRYGREEIFIGSVVYQPFLFTRALSRIRRTGNRRLIAVFAGYLAHYTADLHVPFHLTINYKGQFTDNPAFRDQERGDIHARFETGFVKSHASALAARLRKVRYTPVKRPFDEIAPTCIRTMEKTYTDIFPLLEVDRRAASRAAPDGDWETYLSLVSDVFMERAASRMEASARLLADLFLTAATEPR